MKRNKQLLFGSSLGVLLLLLVAAVEENFLKDWRHLQKASRTEAGPVDVHLRQIVIPSLGATDRCVSCHVGMAPGETGLSGPPAVQPHRDVFHDPSEFGCTVCHAGQGRATEQADAHGERPYWPEPMIPRESAYAGCGACHTHLGVPTEDALRRSRAAFERADCLACHRLDSRGGTVRPGPAGGMEGPDLSRVGVTGFDREWYSGHLDRWRHEDAGPWRISFGPLDEEERRAIGTFLETRVGAPGLTEAKALVHSLGCRGCHKINGVGGDDGPDLTRVGEKDPGRLDMSQVPGGPGLANWFAEHFRAPSKLVPGSLMPAMGLTENQIRELNFYLFSLRRREFPEAWWPLDRIRAVRFGEREFAADGETLYATFCSGCHGPSGQGMRYAGMSPFPAVANRDFLEVASDGFILETLRRGRPGRRMPSWGEMGGGLRPEEIEAIARHVRKLGGVEAKADSRPPRWVAGDPELGRRQYRDYCSGCHGLEGQGLEGPALRNEVLLDIATDTYLFQTIAGGRRGTSMPGFSSATSVSPALSAPEIESVVTFIRTWEKRP